ELRSFVALADRGRVPHGNGNCDLALHTAEVPYGWPVRLVGALQDTPWPDLTLSIVLQWLRAWRVSGLDAVAPMIDALFDLGRALVADAQRHHGVPAGGSTFDTWSFPGTFLYTATLYITAMDGLVLLSERARRDAAIWEEAAAVARERVD